MARIRLLMENFVDAIVEGKKSGEFDIAQVSPDNFEEYYIMFKPITGNYCDQWQILHMKTSYGTGTKYVFPKQSPLIKFVTNVLHTNISTSGTICLDILKENNKWMPTYTFSHIILNIMLLYDTPNGNSPFNCEASRKYIECETLFKREKKTSMSLCAEELIRTECFKPFKAAADKYANSDLSKYAKWFPQIIGKSRTSEDLEQRDAIITSVQARQAAVAEKKKARDDARKSKQARIKKNRWAKYKKTAVPVEKKES